MMMSKRRRREREREGDVRVGRMERVTVHIQVLRKETSANFDGGEMMRLTSWSAPTMCSRGQKIELVIRIILSYEFTLD